MVKFGPCKEQVFLEDAYFGQVFEETCNFCDKMEPSHKYYIEKRGIAIADPVKALAKAWEDDFSGKMAEHFTRQFLATVYGIYCNVPDDAIREGKAKGWFYDLIAEVPGEGIKNIHVKSCYNTEKRRFVRDGKDSWLFQYKNQDSKGGLDTLFSKGTAQDIIICVFIPKLGLNSAYIEVVLPWTEVKPLLKDPLLAIHKETKRALYLKNVVHRFSINNNVM